MRLGHASTIQALDDDCLIDADGKIIKQQQNYSIGKNRERLYEENKHKADLLMLAHLRSKYGGGA